MSNREQITYVLDVKAEVAQAEQAVQGLKDAFSTVKLPVLKSTQISGQIQKLEDEIQNFKTLTEKNEVNLVDLKDIENSRKRIVKFVNDIRTTTRGFGDLFKINSTSLLPENIQSNIKKVTTAFEKLKKVNNEYNEQTKDSSTILDTFNKRLSEQKKIAEDAQKKLNNYNKAQERIKKYKTQIDNKPNVEEKLTSLEAAQAEREAKGRTNTKIYSETQTKIKKLREELLQTTRAYDLLAIEEKRVANFDKAGYEEQISVYDKIQKELKEYTQQLNNAKVANETAFKEIKQSLTDIPGIDVAAINSIDDLEKQLKELASADIERVEQLLNNLRSGLNNINQPINSFNQKIDETGNKIRELTERERDLESFRQRLLYFFSIESIVDLFTQSVRKAYGTVKELDSSMKEIAVVSDYDISDMWSELPEFTKQANNLSVAIKDVYDATGLFVQQGLDLQSSQRLTNQTLQMARIANIEAGDATKYMTAALRSFNMELNETSGQRINDVYSELAAITATDTGGLGVAMSKVASIAASANMEFESTAAFLAQIIETTQEAPETAGTALKTIISRFSEVKKLREEGLGSGVDEEGETIDVNKIQTALRSVGISMDEFFAGSEGLDSILIKLAEKWNTLDFETQRYL